MFLAVLRGVICAGVLEGVVALLFIVVCMAERGECSGAHGHEFDEEEHKDGHERNAFGPVVVCYWARKARICEGIAGRSQEVDERRGYDDAGAKVFRNEECPLRYSHALMPTRVDGEGGPCSSSSVIQSVGAFEIGCWRVPNIDPTSITKIADTRTPIRPS